MEPHDHVVLQNQIWKSLVMKKKSQVANHTEPLATFLIFFFITHDLQYWVSNLWGSSNSMYIDSPHVPKNKDRTE